MKSTTFNKSDPDSPGCRVNAVPFSQGRIQEQSGITLIMEKLRHLNQQDAWLSGQVDCTDGRLAMVASCYAEFASLSNSERTEQARSKVPYWPWEEKWWEPVTRLQDLIHAGALIAAEIDRLLKVE